MTTNRVGTGWNVVPFCEGWEPAAAAAFASAVIAYKHLQIRLLQEREDSNRFTDIFDSQAELRAIPAFYSPPGRFFVAEVEGAGAAGFIAGFVGLRDEGAGVGRLKRLAVMPDYRGRGIATALVGAAISYAADAGFVKVVLSTGVRERARGIYERAGFVVVGTDGREKDYLMELVL